MVYVSLDGEAGPLALGLPELVQLCLVAPWWRDAPGRTTEELRAVADGYREDLPDLDERRHRAVLTFGPGWELGSWHTPDAQGVLQLRHHNTPIGWAAPLPEGPWGQAGWIALLYQPQGANDWAAPSSPLSWLLSSTSSSPASTGASSTSTDATRPPDPVLTEAAAGSP